MIKAYVFDIGNVVWDYRTLYDELFQNWAQILNIPFDQFWDEYLEVYIDFETDRLKLTDWIKKLDSQLNPKNFYQKIDEILGNSPRFSSYLDQDIVNLIQNLKNKEIKVGCLSNTENFVSPFFKKNIEPFFDFSILSWQVKCRKPDPEIYQQIFKHVNCQPDEVIFIDDRLKNVEGAVNLGINGILFQDYQQLITDISTFQK